MGDPGKPEGGKEEEETFTDQLPSHLILRVTSKVDTLIPILQGRTLRHRDSTNFPRL